MLLSVLLGSHPPQMPVRTLVRTAELFGISEGTARVALSRLNADGEVVADGGTYVLSARHLGRQRRQDAALRPATRPWRGGWELAMVLDDPAGRPGPIGPEVRRMLEQRRLAELRPGIWLRPDNLVRTQPPNGTPGGPAVAWWSGRPAPGGPTDGQLVGRLWDLDGWAGRAGALMDELRSAAEPGRRLAVAAAIVRHIRADPVLPPALLPAGWPGARLRRAYDAYRTELGDLIAGLRDE